MKQCERQRRKRAFTLIEAVVVIVALAVAVPPTLTWMDENVRQRADAVAIGRATVLATTVMENILADTASATAGLGINALASTAVWLDTPVTGLRARIAPVTSTYTAAGYSYDIQVGALVDSTGVVNATPAMNIYRIVTVVVTFPTATGASQSLRVSSMVTQL
jgi:type II secretory pathway pseudopilin PulG